MMLSSSTCKAITRLLRPSRASFRRCFTATTVISSSSSTPPPLSLGYVAGLQATNPDNPWNGSFEEAYSTLQQVDPQLLLDFEEDIWQSDGFVFRHSTKGVSVIDRKPYRTGDSSSGNSKGNNKNNDNSEDDDSHKGATRFLVFNDRPKLVQSAIEIEEVILDTTGRETTAMTAVTTATIGRPKHVGAPPPLCGPTATHLGGLALAAPLWMADNNKTLKCSDDNSSKREDIIFHRPPRTIVLGAGGCTIPAVLSLAGCHVTAVEPSDDVREAAIAYFGVKEAGIDLVAGYGEDYLMKKCNHGEIDILIIDAEDGSSAPPKSMREADFWTNLVVPSLAQDAVVAVNLIGSDTERMEIQKTVEMAFGAAGVQCKVWCCNVPKIAEFQHAEYFGGSGQFQLCGRGDGLVKGDPEGNITLFGD